jgi:hypothetical protein
MNKSPLPIIDSYPRLAADPSVSARYWLRRVPSRLGHLRASSDGSRCSVTCALVSRDPEAPRSRRALHGRGRQFLELRSQLCGTITTVQKDTLVWIERT